MPGRKTSCHDIIAEISVAIHSVYQKFVGFAFLVENEIFWQTAHQIYVMEPMRISCAEVIEMLFKLQSLYMFAVACQTGDR